MNAYFLGKWSTLAAVNLSDVPIRLSHVHVNSRNRQLECSVKLVNGREMI
jgi:hypothetical protein